MDILIGLCARASTTYALNNFNVLFHLNQYSTSTTPTDGTESTYSQTFLLLTSMDAARLSTKSRTRLGKAQLWLII